MSSSSKAFFPFRVLFLAAMASLFVPGPSVWGRGSKVKMLTSTVAGISLERTEVKAVRADGKAGRVVRLNPEERFQTMDGFGAAITYSSAYNLLKMKPDDRHRFLEETYSKKKGMGFSYARVSIGCSDFSSTEYTCCDKPGLENFSLHTDETDYVIPVLKEILRINPELKIIGSPWTCPRWMKVKDLESLEPYESWTDGHINPKYYQDYADYFVKWIRAFEAEGIPIYAVTPQNEPLNRGNCASTYVSWKEEAELLRVMAPTFKKAGLKTKIYAFDHNYNYDNIGSEKNYPINIYSMLNGTEGAEYVVGAAYHNYGGSYEELDHIHRQNPEKELIFSEASIGTWNNGRDLGKSLLRDVNELALATVNRWCKAVVVWNLMLDTKRGPNLDGGCQTCYGAVDIDAENYRTIHRNSHYYAIAHLSAVVRPDAVRIGCGETETDGLTSAAFQNKDGSYALVFCNSRNESRTLCVTDGQKQFSLQIPARGVVSCLW